MNAASNATRSTNPRRTSFLETFDGLMKGGETGAALVPGKSAEEFAREVSARRGGEGWKKKFMPPGKREKLSKDDIALIAAWIDAGGEAARPLASRKARTESADSSRRKVAPRRAITALAFSEKPKLLPSADTGASNCLQPTRAPSCANSKATKGNVNALVFSARWCDAFRGEWRERTHRRSARVERRRRQARADDRRRIATRSTRSRYRPMDKRSRPAATISRSSSGTPRMAPSARRCAATTARSTRLPFAPMENCSPAPARIAL
jgi:hypothetical protein